MNNVMEASTKNGGAGTPGCSVSVYYAASLVNRSLQDAWRTMLDYQAWNPSFVGATVMAVRGSPGSEGEVVLIKKELLDATGAPLPEFYAETVKVVPCSHIVWYVYPREGNSFRNFVDFALVDTPNGVMFSIYYYAQNQLAADVISAERIATQASLDDTAVAFKRYCEAKA